MNGDFYSSFDRYRSDLFDSIYDYKIRSSDDYWTTASSTLGRKLTFDHNYFIEDEESEKLYMKLSVFDKMARDVLDELDPGHEFLYISGFTMIMVELKLVLLIIKRICSIYLILIQIVKKKSHVLSLLYQNGYYQKIFKCRKRVLV